METILTSFELNEKLHLLKNTFQSFDYNIIENLVFFNMDSLYNYFKNIKCNHNYTVSDIFDEIEMYIPLALSQESLDLFFNACMAVSNKDTEQLRQRFSIQSRLDFINLLRSTDEVSWKKILNFCEDMRRDKELIFV